jgi:cobalt-zinc-cadmium efflux system protein
VHAWSISQERPMVTLHADILPGTDSIMAIREIKQMLAEHFDIVHATVEVEYGDCVDDAHRHRGAAC